MGRNRLVMVADPDPASRAHTVDLLRDAPYAVVADTDHGREASLIASETQPEVVLVPNFFAEVERLVSRA